MIIWAVLSVFVAGGIFFSSAMPGEASGYASMAVAGFVQRFLPIDLSGGIIDFNFLVRKTAHFVVYFVLAFCVAQSLKFRVSNWKALLAWAWAVVTLYGITDEVHQYFVPGRAMSVGDMFINSAGAFAGAFLVVIFLRKSRMLRD